jgi:hypothetical protein
MKLKHDRVAEVKVRTEAHNKLTTQEKIDKAKSRRGNSKREIARLTAQLEFVKQPVKEVKPKKVKHAN